MGPLYYFTGQILGTVTVSLLLWVSTRYASLTEILAFDTILFSVLVLNNLALILGEGENQKILFFLPVNLYSLIGTFT